MTCRRITTTLILGALAFLGAAPAFAFPVETNGTTVQEYVNDFTGHYFLAADASDEAVLDSGAAGAGWHRTTYSFKAFVDVQSPDEVPVFRFYAPSSNSHFYTGEPGELAAVRAPNSGWLEEGRKFVSVLPAGGSCPGMTPIHRLYGASGHRYVFDDAVRANMVAAGWIDEGVHLCTPTAFKSYVKRLEFSPTSGMSKPLADCENEVLTEGSCIGLAALPALSTRVDKCFENDNNCVAVTPYWNPAFNTLTGTPDAFGETLYTAQPPNGPVLAHSYVVYNFPDIGVHIASADAQAPLASVDGIYQLSTRVPGEGAADARVFPWRFARDNYIDLNFQLTPAMVRRSDAQGQGYGQAILEFRDMASGATLEVAVLMYGTLPTGDFVGIDSSTGNANVSTTAGAHMLFGTLVSGGYVACDGGGPCATGTKQATTIDITAQDFAAILARAKTVNPSLSSAPADYLLANFRFRNGILGNAELGADVASMALNIYGY